MDDRHDRHVDPRHRSELRCIATCCVHQVIANDPALIRDDLPAPVGQTLGVGHEGMALQLGAELPGTLDHGRGGAGRVGPSIVRRMKSDLDVRDVHEGPVPDYLLRGDQMALNVNDLQHALDVAKPVDVLVADGKADGSRAVPPAVQAGLGLERCVQFWGDRMALGHVEAADEVRHQSSGVPGGTRRQLTLLDQDRVCPTFVGQKVHEPGAHGAASNDDHLRLVAHETPYVPVAACSCWYCDFGCWLVAVLSCGRRIYIRTRSFFGS